MQILSGSVAEITKAASDKVGESIHPNRAIRMLFRLSNRIDTYINTYLGHSQIQSERNLLEWAVAGRHLAKDFQRALRFFEISDHPQVQPMLTLFVEESPGLRRRTDATLVEDFRRGKSMLDACIRRIRQKQASSEGSSR
jgi:hypothetical protein